MEASTTSLNRLNDQQRKTLIDSIKDGTCILVLGPYANLTSDGRSQRVVLANYLAEHMPTSMVIDDQERDSFGSIVGRILLDPNYNRTDILDRIRDFYKEFDKQPKNKVARNSPYDLILRLGFKTIFTTDPDSRLMNLFPARNKDVLGLYFTTNSQPGIITHLGVDKEDYVPDKNTPVVINLFGIRDDPNALAIGPKDEIQQLNALTSKEVSGMINKKIGTRLSGCRWYLFVGFNFNSWALATIFYLFNKLTEKITDSRVFGLHSKPDVMLKEATKVYFKNLFPNEKNKNDILIDHQDAQTFFSELYALYTQAEQAPITPPPAQKKVFIVSHPKDHQKALLSDEKNPIDLLLRKLDDKFKEFERELCVQYSTQVTPFTPPLTRDEIQHHILNDDIIVFLISANWEDPYYDTYLELALERDCNPTQVKGILLDTSYNILDINREQKPAFDNGAVQLLNLRKPLDILDNLDQVLKEFDQFLEDTVAPT